MVTKQLSLLLGYRLPSVIETTNKAMLSCFRGDFVESLYRASRVKKERERERGKIKNMFETIVLDVKQISRHILDRPTYHA